MNRSLFLIPKVILSNGNLSYRIKIYPVTRNLYLKSKFILSTFRSLPLLSLSYPEENSLHCKSMFCFRCGMDCQLRGISVLIVEQEKNYYIGWR